VPVDTSAGGKAEVAGLTSVLPHPLAARARAGRLFGRNGGVGQSFTRVTTVGRLEGSNVGELLQFYPSPSSRLHPSANLY
jgi:hypothetical protein